MRPEVSDLRAQHVGEPLLQLVGANRLRHGGGLWLSAGAARQHDGDAEQQRQHEAGERHQRGAGGDGDVADDEKDFRHGPVVADSHPRSNE